MKKASVFLIALVLIIASVPLFAQGKWTNWSEGIIYPFYQVGSAAATNGWGPNWAGPGAYQSWTFAYDGNNYGFSSIFEFGHANFSVANLSWFQAYYKLFDMVKITAGKPNIRDYRLTTKIEGNGYNALFNWGDNSGLALQLMPMSGVSLGAALYVPVAMAAIDVANSIGAGASYAIPDMATIAVDFKNTVAAKQLSVGANITAVKDIGVVVAYQADFTTATLKNSAFLSASAAFAPVTVKVDAAIVYITALNYAAEVNLEYAMAPWTLGITAGYDDGVNWNGAGIGIPAKGLGIFPYVAAGFDNGSSVKVGFAYASGSGASPVAEMGLPIIFTWAF